MSTDRSSSRNLRNPLAVIALLIGICELTIGAVTALSAGPMQILFAVFFVVFTIGVATVFFVILFGRPEVLYGPGDFKDGTTFKDYVEGISRTNRRSLETTQSVAVSSFDQALREEQIEPELRDRILGLARRNFDESSLLIQLPPGSRTDHIEMAVTAETTVSEMLDLIWISLDVPAFSYGQEWTLVRDSDGQVLSDIGSQWARHNLKHARDPRTLAEAGIEPGESFMVRLL